MFPYSGRASTTTTVCDRHPYENDRYDYSCNVHDAMWYKLDNEQQETLSEKHFNQQQQCGVYFGATGGTAVFLSGSFIEAKVVAFEDLGTKALPRLKVKDMPVIEINDCYGGNLYSEGVGKYHFFYFKKKMLFLYVENLIL